MGAFLGVGRSLASLSLLPILQSSEIGSPAWDTQHPGTAEGKLSPGRFSTSCVQSGPRPVPSRQLLPLCLCGHLRVH